MTRGGRFAGALACLVLLALAAPALAADPGRWKQTGQSEIPLVYYQGAATDTSNHIFFDGVDTGLWRSDRQLRQQAGNGNVIPADVMATEGYNHIGDITWDRAEGGRVLLPMESYVPGGPNGGNPSLTGSVAVADPGTLQWRYYVKLDPRFISKVMWNEVSPDGELLWTQAGNGQSSPGGHDLIAYRTSEITRANAAPLGKKLAPALRLKDAVPPPGITGAVFEGDHTLLTAGQNDDTFQVWSIDLNTGAKKLEIERTVVGESEGLAMFAGFGGELHWMIQPYNNGRPPTYGVNHGELLHFTRVAGAPTPGPKPVAPPATRPLIHLTITPGRVRGGRWIRYRFLTSALVDGRRQLLAGVTVRFQGRRVTTDSRGRASMTRRFFRTMRLPVFAGKRGTRSARGSVVVVRAAGR